VNNLPKVVTQQHRGRGSNLQLLDRKSDALPLSHRATHPTMVFFMLEWDLAIGCMSRCLSHAGIASKLMNLGSYSFYRQVVQGL